MGLATLGAAIKIQPLHVAFNAEFKKSVDRLTTEHFFANPELFMSEKVSAGDRRVLFKKWVGTAWQEISRRLKDTVIRLFVKCGIALPIHGSRDSELNIDGLPDYRMNWMNQPMLRKGRGILLWLRGGKLSAFSPWHTNAFYIAVYIEFSILVWRNVLVVN